MVCIVEMGMHVWMNVSICALTKRPATHTAAAIQAPRKRALSLARHARDALVNHSIIDVPVLRQYIHIRSALVIETPHASMCPKCNARPCADQLQHIDNMHPAISDGFEYAPSCNPIG